MSPYVIPGIKRTDIMLKADDTLKIDAVIAVVCRYTGISVEQMNSPSRKREIVYARYMCMWFLRKYSKLTLKALGKIFGGRDHTTAIHAINSVQDWSDVDLQTQWDLARINEILF